MVADECFVGRLNKIFERARTTASRSSIHRMSGFLEKVYENALAHALRKARIAIRQQVGVSVIHDGMRAGLAGGGAPNKT